MLTSGPHEMFKYSKHKSKHRVIRKLVEKSMPGAVASVDNKKPTFTSFSNSYTDLKKEYYFRVNNKENYII
jgi:hypothetical protein